MFLALLEAKMKLTLLLEMSMNSNVTCLCFNIILDHKSHMVFFVIKCI